MPDSYSEYNHDHDGIQDIAVRQLFRVGVTVTVLGRRCGSVLELTRPGGPEFKFNSVSQVKFKSSHTVTVTRRLEL
jgi:hypothetical protein